MRFEWYIIFYKSNNINPLHKQKKKNEKKIRLALSTRTRAARTFFKKSQRAYYLFLRAKILVRLQEKAELYRATIQISIQQL